MIRSIACLLIAFGCASLAGAETAQEFLDRNEAKSLEIKSWEIVSELHMKSPQAEVITVSTTESKRTADGLKTLSIGQTTIATPKQPRTVSEIKMVSDGKTTFTETKSNGKVQVAKSLTPADQTGYGTVRKGIENGGKPTIKPVEDVNGEKCGVLEVAFGEGPQALTYTYWVAEKSGLLAKMESKSAAYGESTLTVKSLKTNVEIPDSKFQYTPPENIPVQDMTAPAAAPVTK